jgi:hypothetical protein
MSGTDGAEQELVRKDRPSGGRCSSVFRLVKGPWRVVNTRRAAPQLSGAPLSGGLGIVGSDGRRVAHGTKRASMQWLDGSHPRSFAEAHIIAAAPEMLETLKAARENVNDPKVAARIDRVVAMAEKSLPISDVFVPEVVAAHKRSIDRGIENRRRFAAKTGDYETHQRMEDLSRELYEEDKAAENERQTAIDEARAKYGFVPAALGPQPWQVGKGKRKPGEPKPKFTEN